MFLGRPVEAIDEYRKALRTRLGDTYNRYAMIGYASLLTGQYGDAVTWIEKALAANPNVVLPFVADTTPASLPPTPLLAMSSKRVRLRLKRCTYGRS